MLWWAVVLLGWAFDFLFWGHEPGISFAIYVLLTLCTGFLLIRSSGGSAAVASLALLLPVLFFALVTFNRAEPFTLFLAHGFTLAIMILFAAGFHGGRWPAYSVADYVVKIARLFGSILVEPVRFRAETRATPAEAGVGSRRPAARLWPVLRGVLIALPVIVIFSALFSSADLVFASRLERLVELFRLEKLPEYIFRAIYILVIAYALAGVYLHAWRKSDDATLLGTDKPLVAPFLGFTESAIVLGSVVALFAVFVFIQVEYFFGGQANIGVEGYTYAQYARRGFGELVAVAFFSLLLFLGLSAITRRETRRQQNIFTGLGVALTVLVGVILLSAYYRLVLYETAYGFTRARTYTNAFLIWVGILLLAVVVLELLGRQRMFAFAALMAAIGFVASLSVLNVDAFIAGRNIERAEAGYELDVAYLASLSADAVPVLVQQYESASIEASIREQVGAALACMNSAGTYPYQPADWRSLNLAYWRADQAIMPVLADIADYTLSDREVIAPDGASYPCWSYYD
jgi:hypothetical protein